MLASPLKYSAGRLVEHFIHPSFHGESDKLYRARVLVALLLGLNFLLIPACIADQLADLPRREHIINAVLTLVVMLGNSALLVKLRRHGSYAFCSTSAVLLITTACSVSIAVSGGVWRSPVALLLATPVLMAYFFGGVRSGNRMAALAATIVLGFIALEVAGVPLPASPATSPHALTVLQFIVVFVCVSAVSALAFIYEFTATLLKRERDRNHRKAVVLAQTDVLTGLVNRRSFEAHLQQRIEAHSRMQPPVPFILCYLDLDDFKTINDRHGHAVGDEVLQNVAERLHAAVRGSDIVGRHGGDEFMVLLDATHGAADAQLMAERTLESIRRPIHTQVGTLAVGASLGFAVYPHDATTIEALKKTADSAMYAAKRGGGNDWKISLEDNDTQATAAPPAAGNADASSVLDGVADIVEPSTPRAAPVFESGYARVVEWFVPASLRLDSDTLHRTRILVMALLLMLVVVTAAAAVVASAPLPLPSKIANLLITIPIALITAFFLWQLRRNGDYRFCSTATVIALLVGNVAGICVSGGLSYSPAGALLAVPTLLAFFFGGVRRGTAVATTTLLVIFFLLGAELAGMRIYNTSDLADAPFNQLLVNCMGLVVLGGMAFIYEFTTAALMRERDLEHEKVNRLAYTDSLTGLANRLDFDAELQVRIARFNARITRSSFALCMLDLDGFKPINDDFGHDIGDVVLQTVSERLLACLRDADYVGRQGGDEFMLIFDAVSTATQVEVFAKRLAQVLEPPIETPAGPMQITGSLGFALFPGSAADADALKRAADRAMYTAKRSRSGWSVETR